MNIGPFKDVWYPGNRKLTVIFSVAEQNLSVEVHFLKLQLD